MAKTQEDALYTDSPALIYSTAKTKGDTLYTNEVLSSQIEGGQQLLSRNGKFILIMQQDGDLVQYIGQDPDPANAIFRSGTANKGLRAVMLSDGRLVVYDRANYVVWASSSQAQANDKYRLVLENDGDAVIYSSADVPIWSNLSSGKLTLPLTS